MYKKLKSLGHDVTYIQQKHEGHVFNGIDEVIENWLEGLYVLKNTYIIKYSQTHRKMAPRMGRISNFSGWNSCCSKKLG